MTLYTLCLKPFLNILDQRLAGIRNGSDHDPVSVVAYADVVTIFPTSVLDLQVVDEAIQLFEKACGAPLNPTKSRSLPIGRWRIVDTVRDIAYHPSVIILGVSFWSTIHKSATATWSHLTGQVSMLARESYLRDLCFAHRIQYFNTYLLAKIWYTAQISLFRVRPYNR
jgi:hypothetical protein